MLVLIGATPEGRKELVGFQVGVRESAQSWRELLVDVKHRGLSIAPPLASPTGCACRSLKPAPPEIAVGDGALGFWKAVDEVSPGTRHQRCWLHKAKNLLNKVPKSIQEAMKADIREISMAPTRAAAEAAIKVFVENTGPSTRRGQVPEGRRVPHPGPERAACLLRLPSRTLGSPEDHKPHRVGFRHRPASNHPHDGGPVPFAVHPSLLRRPWPLASFAQNRPADGLQARHGGCQDLSKAEGRKPVAQGRRRCHV